MSALDCGHEPTPGPISTGIVTAPGGRTMCYPCADAEQRAEFAKADVFAAYISLDGKRITTWSGGELAKVVSLGRTGGGFGGTQHHVRAVAPDGLHWYGRNGGTGMYVNLRRAKVRA